MKLTKFFLPIIFSAVAATALGLVSLYFGGQFLTSPLMGGDDAHALFHVDYLYRNWPNQALWQPASGAGFSLHAVNYGAFWTTAMTAKLFAWTPAQAMHFWQFFNFYLTSLGIFVLGWMLLGPLTGLLAGFFFLLSQISWFWEARIGLFAFQTSFFLVPLYFIFLHQSFSRKSQAFLHRLFLALSALVLAAAIWFHLVTAVLLIASGFLFSLFAPLSPATRLSTRLTNYFLTVVLGTLLSSPFLLPFIAENSQQIKGQVTYLSPADTPSLSWLTFWGLKPYVFGVKHDLWYGFFAFPVVILLLLGALLAFVKKHRIVLCLLVISLVFSFLASFTYHLPGLAQIFSFFFSFTNIRNLLLPIIFLPLIAAYGVVTFTRLLTAKIKPSLVRLSLIALISLGLSAALVWQLDRTPAGVKSSCASSYGPDWVIPDCRDFTSKLPASLSQFFRPTTQTTQFAPGLSQIASYLPSDAGTRADITAKRGEYIELWGTLPSVPILASYDFTRIIPYWNYQVDQFYTGKGTTKSINQLASWFGIDYVILDKGKNDPISQFSDWSLVNQAGDIQIYHSPAPTGLTTLSDRPTILFFGDTSQEAYFKWWQMLTNGGMDYSQAFVAAGGNTPEKLTPSQINQFDILVFWGEKFGYPEKVNQLIGNFLDQGGKVLIDTGWQYTSTYWENDVLPSWLPVGSTKWHEFNSWHLETTAPSLSLVGSWATPKWEGQPWGTSTADSSSLRPTATPLITDANTHLVLAAKMSHGKGEVIWTGLNLVGIYQTKNPLVSQVYRQLMSPFLSATGKDYSHQFHRSGPETVALTLPSQDQPLWLYFRESFSPTWQAKSNSSNSFSLYPAGPGFVLTQIPSQTSQVTFSHRPFTSRSVGYAFAAVALLGIFTWLAKGSIMKKAPPHETSRS